MAKKKALNSFTVNGNKYLGKDYDFNTAADFDMMGISISDFGKKNLAVARAYLATYNDNDLVWAGNEIQSHIVNGGNLADLFAVLSGSLANSDFFQALSKGTETETQQDTEEETTEE